MAVLRWPPLTVEEYSLPDLTAAPLTAAAPTADGVAVTVTLPLPGTGSGQLVVSFVVIHEADRFDPSIPARSYPLAFAADSWSGTVIIAPEAGTNFGLSGRYLYRFQLSRADGTVIVPWFTDPFARATDDVGQLSAFDTADTIRDFTWGDDTWKVPDGSDLVVYELQVEEFNGTFAGVAARLPYLQSLGVNCLELMPVTTLRLTFDWGYQPLHYFAPNERWGGAAGLKSLVNACHQAGVAVILDMVFQHVDASFAFNQVYEAASLPSPMIGGTGQFGPEVDYARQFSRDYVHAVTDHWLTEYHVDGFRYDEVTDLYTEPTGDPYAGFAYDVYNTSLALPRFTPSGGTAPGEYSRVIQIPEALNRPQEVLTNTYSTATWQDGLLDKAEDMAVNGCYVDDDFAHLLDASFSRYPATKPVHDIAGNPVDMPVNPVQYLNSHDHSHLLAYLTQAGRDPAQPLADRTPWYKIQPFVVAQYTAQGIPMLWQGQEVSDNWVLPDHDPLRTPIQRDFHWEYFYDLQGSPLVRLHRILGALRRTCPALHSRTSFYYYQQSRTGDGIIAYCRSTSDLSQHAMVMLNFSDNPQPISVPAPAAGIYRELVDAATRPAPLQCVATAPGDTLTVTVPSNYGYVLVGPA
jgi:maltooligosyltrehalose trehalohydrolase